MSSSAYQQQVTYLMEAKLEQLVRVEAPLPVSRSPAVVQLFSNTVVVSMEMLITLFNEPIKKVTSLPLISQQGCVFMELTAESI